MLREADVEKGDGGTSEAFSIESKANQKCAAKNIRFLEFNRWTRRPCHERINSLSSILFWLESSRRPRFCEMKRIKEKL